MSKKKSASEIIAEMKNLNETRQDLYRELSASMAIKELVPDFDYKNDSVKMRSKHPHNERSSFTITIGTKEFNGSEIPDELWDCLAHRRKLQAR